jgi:CheY-like chemotaxis protein
MKLTDDTTLEILLVEDSPSDVQLTLEALKDAKVLNRLHVARDGVEAIEFLRKQHPHQSAPRPDLILLDLNLPRKDGREVLAEIKNDDSLRTIPVVVLTTSKAEEDVFRSYALQANCYIVKPVDLNSFLGIIQAIESFWLKIVRLPTGLSATNA